MPLYKNTHGIGALHLGSATVGLEVRSLHRGPGITTHLHCGTGEVKVMNLKNGLHFGIVKKKSFMVYKKNV